MALLGFIGDLLVEINFFCESFKVAACFIFVLLFEFIFFGFFLVVVLDVIKIRVQTSFRVS
jgi:hypothetical protein